jgi:hypothetical protein
MNSDYRLVNIHVPKFIIPVGQLSQPSDLYTICRNAKLETYCYAIYWKHNLLKVGISHPSKKDRKNTNTFGERLVRQISKSPGWTAAFINHANNTTSGTFIQNYGYISDSENGLDFKLLIEDYQRLNNVQIHKDDMYIQIWNLTNINSTIYHFDDSDKGRENKALYFEAVLIDQYKTNHLGKLPLGNTKHDPSIFNRIFHKPKITHSVAQMFDGI